MEDVEGLTMWIFFEYGAVLGVGRKVHCRGFEVARFSLLITHTKRKVLA